MVFARSHVTQVTELRASTFGLAMVRDPDNVCFDFDPDGEKTRECEGDGHYMCRECRHHAPFDYDF